MKTLVRKSQNKWVFMDILKKKRKELTIMAAVNYNTENFRKDLKAGKIILVDYWAPWCTYCRRIGPAYEKIAEEYGERLVISKINIDEEGALAQQERIEVIPTLVLYKGGQAVASIVAPESKAVIENFIEENLG